MATRNTTPLSDSEALSAAVEVLEHLALRMDEASEARDRFLLLALRMKVAAKKSRQGKDYIPIMVGGELFHVLDEDRVPLCLSEDNPGRRADGSGFCEDCSNVTRQLAEWDVEGER